MDKVFFQIGDRIEMTKQAAAGDIRKSDRKYGSMLMDFDGIRTVRLSMPIYEGRVIPLEVGDVYELCFFTGSGLYQCTGRITKRYIEDRIHMMDVFLITELQKFQRRRFYRLDCLFQIRYRVLSEVEQLLRRRMKEDNFETEEDRRICEGALEKIPKKWEDGSASDLSGGGIRFQCSKEWKKGTKFEVMLPLSFQKGIVPVTFDMSVVSCSRYGESLTVYEVRGEFENVTDSERETVIRYVFEEQRRRMRKE